MKSFAYILLGMKLFLAAFLPLGLFTMPVMDMVHAQEQTMMSCLGHHCDDSAATNSTACLDHCVNTLKTDSSLPIAQVLPMALVFIAFAAVFTFFVAIVLSGEYAWERAAIGKTLQRRFLRTVILRD